MAARKSRCGPSDVRRFRHAVQPELLGVPRENGQNGAGSRSCESRVPGDCRRWVAQEMDHERNARDEMPAFGESAGGFLTEKQVDALVGGNAQRTGRSGGIAA